MQASHLNILKPLSDLWDLVKDTTYFPKRHCICYKSLRLDSVRHQSMHWS